MEWSHESVMVLAELMLKKLSIVHVLEIFKS